MTKRLTLIRRSAKHQRGITLLEIMIVLAIIALVMGFLIGPRVFRALSKSEKQVAKAEAKQFAYDAYTEFRSEKRKSCPASLDDLLEYMDKTKNVDPWGNPYEMFCKEKMKQVAPGVKHPFGVRSAGPDGQPGNEDDIRSWDE